jgi:CPA1 family monovalent cation:H+ antiporter
LIVAAAVLGYANHRWLRLPASVGLTVMGAIASLLVLVVDRLMPSSQLAPQFNAFLGQLDFHRTLMEGMLSFLLFAGALHVDWSHMRKGRWPIIIFSTIGVLISTVVVGFAFWLAAGWLGVMVPLGWALVFGALISPTDPVAVMAVMKRAAMPPTLQATVAGESLFNDGGRGGFHHPSGHRDGRRGIPPVPRGDGFPSGSGRRGLARPDHRLDRLSRHAQHR